MAYINADDVKIIRNELKAEFPKYKFSVRREHHSSVNISIMSGPMDFNLGKNKYGDDNHGGINHLHLNLYPEAVQPMLKKVSEIAHKKHWDKSDIQSDYFHCAYFVHINVGKWDIPYVQK